jgi:CRISPR-associated endonuclease/helicase Cas3
MAAPELLAKSAPGALGRNRYTAVRRAAGLPDGFRHECWSVALLRSSPILAGFNDPDLVVWLVGAHHGYGRPWFPVVPDIDTLITVDLFGHHLQAGTVHGLEGISAEWPALFDRLQRRYGWWGLAYLEAVMRLSDHRQSANEAANNSGPAKARTASRAEASKAGV